MALDHKVNPRPIEELPDGQIALATVNTPAGSGQIMVLRVNGVLVDYHGGRAVEYPVLDWRPITERR